MPQINILNKHHGHKQNKNTFYIGRGSPLGNPYVIGEKSSVYNWGKEKETILTREDAIDEYEIWLEDQIKEGNPKVCDELDRIANQSMKPDGVNLLCFCYPKLCHGSVIKKVIINAFNKMNQTKKDN